MTSVERRRYLLSSLSVAVVSTSGCLNLISSESCEDSEAATVAVRHVQKSPKMQNESNPLSYEELTEGEQDIVQTAMSETEYRKCLGGDPYIPPAIDTLTDRVIKHRSESWNTYIKYNGSYYAISLTIEDESYSSLPINTTEPTEPNG